MNICDDRARGLNEDARCWAQRATAGNAVNDYPEVRCSESVEGERWP